MKKDQNLIENYIMKAFEAGISEADIKKYLKEAGWEEQDISYALTKFNMKTKSKILVPRNYRKDLRENSVFYAFCILVFIAIFGISEILFQIIDLLTTDKKSLSMIFSSSLVLVSGGWAALIYFANSKSLFKINTQSKFITLSRIVGSANIAIFVNSVFFIYYILNGEYFTSTFIKIGYVFIVAIIIKFLSTQKK